MRRALRILSVALITAGLVVLADAGVTFAWKEPVSAIYAGLQQGQARDELRDLEQTFEADPVVARSKAIANPERRARRLARLFAAQLEADEGIGTVSAPDAGIDQVIVEGTSAAALEKGPGHYPDTALPGQGRTIGIAGHRTTYGAPFRKIDKLEKGDEVVLEMPYGTFTYRVTKTEVVEPTAVEIVEDLGRERLVLTACHPLYSAAERYAVSAEPKDVSLAGDSP